MTQLVAYYDEKPLDLKGKVELDQRPMASAGGTRSTEGVITPSVVYVQVHSEAGALLVPFGEFAEWSLRDRYNEAIRIMNTLGASTITCDTFREVSKHRLMKFKVAGKGPKLKQQRVENSGFDFKHVGAGSVPRDPRPLRWPDEPGFAAAVSSVLDNAATQVTINIRSSRTYATDGSLALQLKKIGFSLGGSSQHSGETSLHIHAEFPPAKKGWLG